MGTSSHFRISNRIPPVSLPEKLSSSSSFFEPTGSHHLRRSRSSVAQRCHHRLYRRHLLRRIHIKHLPCSQTRREISSCHQFKKSSINLSHFSTSKWKGYTQYAVCFKIHGKIRLKGRILHSSNVYRQSKVSQIYMEPKKVPVLLPTIWVIVSPLGVHKGSQTSDRLPPYTEGCE